MSSRINPCPIDEKSPPVSKTTKPVTQTALTDVKAASISEIPPFRKAVGNSMSKVPKTQSKKKVLRSIRAGWLNRVPHHPSILHGIGFERERTSIEKTPVIPPRRLVWGVINDKNKAEESPKPMIVIIMAKRLDRDVHAQETRRI